jgi:hypothetical protein
MTQSSAAQSLSLQLCVSGLVLLPMLLLARSLMLHLLQLVLLLRPRLLQL